MKLALSPILPTKFTGCVVITGAGASSSLTVALFALPPYWSLTMQRNEYCSLASVKLMLSVLVLLPVMVELTHFPLGVRYCHW